MSLALITATITMALAGFALLYRFGDAGSRTEIESFQARRAGLLRSAGVGLVAASIFFLAGGLAAYELLRVF